MEQVVKWLMQIPVKLVELVLLSLGVTVAAILTIEFYRKSWMTPTAALILGTIFGYGAHLSDGGGWVVFWTLIGVCSGPPLIVALNGKDTVRSLAEFILEKLKNR